MPRLLALAPRDREPVVVHLSPEEFAAILAEVESWHEDDTEAWEYETE